MTKKKTNHTPGIEMRNTEVAEDLKQNRMLEILNRSDSICGEKTKLTWCHKWMNQHQNCPILTQAEKAMYLKLLTSLLIPEGENAPSLKMAVFWVYSGIQWDSDKIPFKYLALYTLLVQQLDIWVPILKDYCSKIPSPALSFAVFPVKLQTHHCSDPCSYIKNIQSWISVHLNSRRHQKLQRVELQVNSIPQEACKQFKLFVIITVAIVTLLLITGFLYTAGQDSRKATFYRTIINSVGKLVHRTVYIQCCSNELPSKLCTYEQIKQRDLISRLNWFSDVSFWYAFIVN